jgi:hypothetical protein
MKLRSAWLIAALCSCTGEIDAIAGDDEATSLGAWGEIADVREDSLQPDGLPPISGGTLVVLRDGVRAWVSDPDRDRGLFVDLMRGEVLRSIQFARDAEPGRAVEDARGRVHVVLRRSGEVASIEPTGERSLRSVCSMPRGIAYQAATDLLHVACRDGDLVSLDAAGREARRMTLEPDLRDVVASGSELWVSTFRHADVIRLDAEGKELSRVALGASNGMVAWRMVGTGDGVVIVHQSTSSGVSPGQYGPPLGSPCPVARAHTRVTFAGAGGSVDTTAPWLDVVLPVDVAVDGGELAVVSAGNLGGEHPRVVTHKRAALEGSECVRSPRDRIAAAGRAVAVAYAGRELVVQLRDPAQLVIGERTIALGGERVIDRGHELFHTSATELADPFASSSRSMAPAGVACASCHPEGADDGRVWDGNRTQSLEGGLAGTAPFHWAGDLPDLASLASEVFSRRMGARELSPGEVGALEAWLDTIPTPAPIPIRDPEAVARGRAIFVHPIHDCVSCHSGSRLMNNTSFDVGTGNAQVPSLVGVGYRLPLMRSGCAPTVADRFDPECGGFAHGGAHLLVPYEREALAAYLESL